MRTGRVLLAVALAAGLVSCGDADDSDATTGASGAAAVTTDTPPSNGRATAVPVTTAPPPSIVAPATSPSPPLPTTVATGVAGTYPVQPAGVPFPDADWPTALLPPGVDLSVLDGAVDAAMGAPDAGSGVRSVVVVQGGAIVYERYHPSVGPDTVMASYSVAKSFTSAIVGLLVDDGLLALDEHPPRPEWPPGDPRPRSRCASCCRCPAAWSGTRCRAS